MTARPPGLVSPAEERLRGLRRRLTIAYTLASTIGLVVLAVLVTVTDGRQRTELGLAEVARLGTLTDHSLVASSDGTIDTSAIEDYQVEEQADVYVVEAADASRPARVVYRTTDPFLEPSDERVVLFAADSLDGVEDDNFVDHIDDGHPVFVSATPQYDEDGEIVGASVTVLDGGHAADQHGALLRLTWGGVVLLAAVGAAMGSWLAGRGLRPAIESLQQQERFLADAAHELRTPLAALRTTVEAGQLEGADALASLDRAAVIAAETGATVDDLLFLARVDAGTDPKRLEPVRLDLLVDEVLLDHPGVVHEGGEVIATVDVALVRRAVRNLVVNALRHGDGQQVVVHAWHDDAAAATRVLVSDRGPGIEPSVLPTLFDRFVTGRRSSGSGLGLAIVQEIAALHGGTIEARNRVDGPGAELLLSLPDSPRGPLVPA